MTRILAIAALLLIPALQAADPTHWLITLQLAPGMELPKLTPPQLAVFGEHAKHLAALKAKGIVVAGGRTEETTGTLAVLILKCDEATARQAVADDPATRAGYLKSEVHPFTLALPPQCGEK